MSKDKPNIHFLNTQGARLTLGTTNCEPHKKKKYSNDL